MFYPLAAGGLRSCHFCHRLITKLSLLSFPSLTEVTVLSLLYMFFGLKSVPWQYFSCHFKSAEWILFITSVQLEHMTIFIAKQRTSCPLDYKWPFKLIFLQSDTSVTSVSVRKWQKWQFCHFCKYMKVTKVTVLSLLIPYTFETLCLCNLYGFPRDLALFIPIPSPNSHNGCSRK